MEAALELQPEGMQLLLLGDLNADLDFPRNRQEEVLAAELEGRGLRCMTNHFVTRRRRRCRGKWTWRRRNKNGKGERAWYRSKPDYFMARDGDRKKFRRCRLVLPPTHNSDHRAMVARLESKGVKEYRDGRKQLPFKRPPKCGLSEGEKLFDRLEREVIKPTRRERDKNS